MRILLDENFPLRLHTRLREAGYEVEHIILARRGIPDSDIIKRLATEPDLVVLTQDRDFEQVGIPRRGKVIISRVRQRLPIDQRVDIWITALESFLRTERKGTLFELDETAGVIPLPE